MHTRGPSTDTFRALRNWRSSRRIAAATLALVIGSAGASNAVVLAAPSGPGVQQAALAGAKAAISVAASAPQSANDSDVILNMFQWTWNSVADQCPSLGDAGFGYVQVSPPQEHVLGEQWWTSYQPVSYKLESKLGTATEFKNMVDTCAGSGVGIIVDAVINHMSGSKGGKGFAGTDYTEENYPGPGSVYGPSDFHDCKADISDYKDKDEVQSCRLVGLQDLDTGSPSVQAKIAGYLDQLADLGVAGFRIDAAKHMDATELQQIKNTTTKAKDLYWVQEVIGSSGEPIKTTDYTGIGDVHEFNYGRAVKSSFAGALSQLQFLATDPGMLPSANAGVFVTNHDTERNGETMNYKWLGQYYMANMFMLSYPYGSPSVYTGYNFSNNDAGAPQDAAGNVLDAVCSKDAFTCDFKNPEIKNMVGFHNLVTGTDINNWQNVTNNVIGYGRGNLGFVALNKTDAAVTHTFQTALPAGTYCNIVAEDDLTNCDEAITVAADGKAEITIEAWSGVAIDVDHASTTGAAPEFSGPLTTVYFPESEYGADAYFHHGAADDWTAVPGLKLTPSVCEGWLEADVPTTHAFAGLFNDGKDSWYKTPDGQDFVFTGPIATIVDHQILGVAPCDPDTFQKTTIYYKTNSSWEAYNIHYQVGSGDWTAVPGVQMSPACEGWVRKTVSSKGSSVTATFNDRGMTWDSKDGANYALYGEVVAVADGVVTEGNPCAGQTELPEDPTLGPALPHADYDSVTVYYSPNPEWTSTNIHYGVAGKWTIAPGIPMVPACEGWLTYTIDGADGVQVVFNNITPDSDGVWDNNNNANYALFSEVAAIKDGQISKVDPCAVKEIEDNDGDTDNGDTDNGGVDNGGSEPATPATPGDNAEAPSASTGDSTEDGEALAQTGSTISSSVLFAFAFLLAGGVATVTVSTIRMRNSQR